MVQMLLDNGANVNETNVHGDTSLHYAVRLGREDLVKVSRCYIYKSVYNYIDFLVEEILSY